MTTATAMPATPATEPTIVQTSPASTPEHYGSVGNCFYFSVAKDAGESEGGSDLRLIYGKQK